MGSPLEPRDGDSCPLPTTWVNTGVEMFLKENWIVSIQIDDKQMFMIAKI